MDRLLQIGLTNALTAMLLALPVAGISRLLRKPPLTRALWILVLLKLLTPPLWSVPLWQTGGTRVFASLLGKAQTARTALADSRQTVAPTAANAAADESADGATRLDYDEPLTDDSITEPQIQPAASAAAVTHNPTAAPRWTRVVVFAWASGSAIYLALILVSMWRVGRLVRKSRPAPPSLQARAGRLARTLGLSRAPAVAFVDRLVPPMLFPFGLAPRILLPVLLWDRLDEDQQNTVLAHELAHLRARDHWMRMLELIAAVLYWWHPLVWWSRHELREAAEQCCDAWVVSALPRLTARYAAALIEAIEFISSAPNAVPALASTMGQFTDLRRRLVMIKQQNAIRSLTRPALAAVFGAAGFVLPLSPSFAQEAAPPAPPAPVAVSVAPVVAVAPPVSDAPVAITIAPDAPSPRIVPDSGQSASPQPDFQFRIDSAGEDAADGKGDDARDGVDRAQYEKARAEVQALRAQLRAAERRLAAMDKARNKRRSSEDSADAAPRPRTATPSYAPMKLNQNFNQEQNDAFARAAEKLRAAGDQLNEARDRTRQALERRLDAMERQMNEMSNQLRQLRRQMSDGPSPEPQKR